MTACRMAACRRAVLAALTVLTALTMLVAGCDEPPATHASGVLSFSGEQRFFPGALDAPPVHLPNAGEAGWTRYRIPKVWGGADIPPHEGWYAVGFDTDAIGHPASVLFQPAGLDSAHEVFVNGTRVGGAGVFGTPGRGSSMSAVLYAIPGELLRPAGEPNVLAIRLQRGALFLGGLAARPIRIGATEPLRTEYADWRQQHLWVDGLFVGIGALFLIFVGGLALVGHGGAQALLLVQLCWLGTYSAANPLFGDERGLLGQTAYLLGSWLLAPSLAYLGVRVSGRPERRAVVAQLSAALLLLALHLLTPMDSPAHTLSVAGLVTLQLVSMGYAVVVTWRAARRGVPDAAATCGALALTGLVGTLIVSIPDAFWPLLTSMTDPTMVLLVVVLMLVFARRLILSEVQRREASVRALDAQHAERARLARDLHDGVGQSVATLRLLLDEARRNPAGQALTTAAEQLSRVADELRATAHALRPPALDDDGVLGALDTLALELDRAGGPELLVDAPEPPGIPPEKAGHVVRLVQEAVANAVRHGQPEQIVVSLTRHGSEVVLRVVDDGVGFDAERAPRSLLDRATLLGGVLTVESAPGAGATVEVRLPTT